MGCTGEGGQSHGRVKPRKRNFLRTSFVLLFIRFRSRYYGTFRSPGRAVNLSYKHSKKICIRRDTFFWNDGTCLREQLQQPRYPILDR
jgi:hypothetical protein